MHATQLFNVIDACNAVVQWGKSLFLLPLRSAGESFIEKIAFFEFLDIQNRERANNNERPDDLTHPIASNNLFQLKIKRKH